MNPLDYVSANRILDLQWDFRTPSSNTLWKEQALALTPVKDGEISEFHHGETRASYEAVKILYLRLLKIP